MAHTDARTGEEITGKALILSTTEGPELVDYETAVGHRSLGEVVAAHGAATAEALGRLTARVEELELLASLGEEVADLRRQVRALSEPTSVNVAAAPTSRKAAGK